MEQRAATKANPPWLGLQLYTLRDQCATDFAGVLRRIAAMGYVGVELFGLHGMPVEEVAVALDDAGLRAASALIGLDPTDEFEATLDAYASLGTETVVVVALAPEDFTSTDALDRAADRLNDANEKARDRSLTLGYHNHWWELETLCEDRPALFALFERLAPEVVAEVDIYWPQVVGVDPAGLVRELGARVAQLHVKDGPVDPAVPMVAVGDGALDIPAILGAASSARWHFVELDDCATSLEVAVARSHDYLVGRGLSQGRAPGALWYSRRGGSE